MSAMLGRRACSSVGGRFRFLLSSNSCNNTRLLCTTNVKNNKCETSETFNQKTHDIFQGDHKLTRTSSFSSISSLLREHESTIDGANIAFLYRTAALTGQVLDTENVKQILKIIRRNKDKMRFTTDDIKEILQGHRYTNDKNEYVRMLLSEILPPRKGIKFDTQRKLGLSLFGLQNMTALHPEIRNVLSTLTFQVARCKEPLDGSTISAALYGTRNMNATKVEVVNFIRVMARKINESTCYLSSSGVAQSMNSLQCKNDKKKEILHLLAVLNTRLESVCHRMSASEVCRALFGLQVMTSDSPVLINSFQLLSSRFVSNDVQKHLTARDLSLALGSLKGVGCSIHETNFLMKSIDGSIQKLTEPIPPKNLMTAFSCFKNMRSTQAGVPNLLSTLTNNIMLNLQANKNKDNTATTTLPNFLFPSILRHMKKMSSDEIAVRNFLSIIADVFSEQKKKVELNSFEFTTCMTGLQSMKSSEPAVRRFLSCLLNSYMNNSQNAPQKFGNLELDWSQICQILEGMSSMDIKSKEVRVILDLIAQNMKRINEKSYEHNDQIINTTSSAMYSMRNMNVTVQGGQKAQEDIQFIYFSLFERLKECCALTSNKQGVGKKTMMSSLGSLTTISNMDESFAQDVMLYIAHEMIRNNKNMAMASPYSYEVVECLEGISSRPATCSAADTLLRSFLLAVSSETIHICENDISLAMKKMKYSKEEITRVLKSSKNREVIGQAEMNVHFQNSISLPESLISLEKSIKDCANGDAVDIFWSSNLLALIKTHDASKFSVKNVASMLQSSCEFSLLFFFKHKRQVLPLRRSFIELTLSVLQNATPTFTNNFDDLYTVFCGTHCLWSKTGKKHGDLMLSKTLDILKQSTFTWTLSDAAKIASLLKKTNSSHSHADSLLSIVNDKIGESIGSPATLDTTEFVSAVRGLRYLLKSSANARHLLNHFIQSADNSKLELNFEELKIAIGCLKNTSSDQEEILTALNFFHNQFKKHDQKVDIKMPVLVYLLSTLRFMDSSCEAVSFIIKEIQKKFPENTSDVSVNHELLCDFIQFFNHKRCEDSPAILNLRDVFIKLMDISGKTDLDMYAVTVVEHMIALKSKRSEDPDMNVVYGSMAMDIISPDHPRDHITPNMFCIGLLGLDVLYEKEGLAGVALFCEKMNECSMEFSFQAVMLALSALENMPEMHHNAAAMDLVLDSLTKKALMSSTYTSKVTFASLLSFLRSLAVLSKSFRVPMEIYPAITHYLSEESFSHHRIWKVLETLEDVDVSSIETQALFTLLLTHMQEINAETYEKKYTLPMLISLERLETINNSNDSAVVQELKREVVRLFNEFGCPKEIVSSSEDLKLLLTAGDSNARE